MDKYLPLLRVHDQLFEKPYTASHRPYDFEILLGPHSYSISSNQYYLYTIIKESKANLYKKLHGLLLIQLNICRQIIMDSHHIYLYSKKCLITFVILYSSKKEKYAPQSLENVYNYIVYGTLYSLPTIVAKISTPARKSATTNKYSASFSGVGVSPIVVNVNVDQ